jgi:site-specific DNA-methyltransferase (adenine-specific)
MWGDEAGKSWERGGAGDFVQPEGRWPANLLLDGSPEVVDLFPESKGQQGDVRGTEPSGVTDEIYGKFNGRVPAAARNDSGSAARFFHNFHADPVIYQSKAGKADRAGGTHPTVKPIALMQYLIRHITPPGGTVLDPFAGSGTTGEAAKREGFNCILMEAEPKYVEFLNSRFELHQEVDDSQLVDSRQNDLQLGGDKDILNWLLSQI